MNGEREIKFRAWDERNKIMHFDFEFIRSGVESNDWIVFKSDKQTLEQGKVLDNPYFQQQLKIMQYTGLHDKNGKEIYEGDIVAIPKRKYEVKYDNQRGCWYGEQANGDSNYISWDKFEVIGNIYENLDLKST